MTTTKQELQEVLINLQETYQAKIEQLESTRALEITGTGYTNHQADDATAVYDQTVSNSTYQATKTRLRQVEEALSRFNNGSYGVCENCGDEIDIARLEAIPYTTYCLRCAESRDYRAGM